MKKLLLISAIGLSLTACTQKESSDENYYDSCLYGGCAKICDDGYQCRRCAQRGSEFCYEHR
jgi:hypothetical protein